MEKSICEWLQTAVDVHRLLGIWFWGIVIEYLQEPLSLSPDGVALVTLGIWMVLCIVGIRGMEKLNRSRFCCEK